MEEKAADLFAVAPSGRQSGGWTNKLIWGDNKLVLASLKNGPLRRDYWSVDFDYHAKQEILTVTLPDATGRMVNRPQWTGGYIFENEWQSFRTRRDRTLELTSAPHAYTRKGRYAIAVKVIDIFGNDTTKVVEVTV